MSCKKEWYTDALSIVPEERGNWRTEKKSLIFIFLYFMWHVLLCSSTETETRCWPKHSCCSHGVRNPFPPTSIAAATHNHRNLSTNQPSSKQTSSHLLLNQTHCTYYNYCYGADEEKEGINFTVTLQNRCWPGRPVNEEETSCETVKDGQGETEIESSSCDKMCKQSLTWIKV